MVIKSYNEKYLQAVAENMGEMFEYATAIGIDPINFWVSFSRGEVARQIEKGNPRYLVGYSGMQLVDIMVNTGGLQSGAFDFKERFDMDKYYWSGWVLAQYQYQSGLSFHLINERMPIQRVLELYNTLHEADITKFFQVAESYTSKVPKDTNLKHIRVARGLTQKQLAEKSTVDIRSIQLYEQRKNNINKAQVDNILKLTKVLGCHIEDLLEA